MSDGTEKSEDAGTPEPPKDAAVWRELLSVLPPAAVLKVLQEEKGRAERIFAGFRPNVGGIHLPVVRDRLIKEAQKMPKLASALAGLTAKSEKATKSEKTSPPKPSVAIPPPADDTDANAALRVKIEKHRAALRDYETKIQALETRLATAEQEAQRAKSEADAARAAERSASERADRLQRLKEREERRPALAPTPKEKTVVFRAAAPPSPAPPLFEETMQRMMEVGKPSLVADLCRYALRTDAAAENAALRGRIHSSLADALNRSNDTANAAEQGRQAVIALLNGGDAVSAANAVARLAERVDAFRKEDATQITRLLKLAAMTETEKQVRDIFLRLALSSAAAFRRLRAVLPPAEAAKLKEASAETTRFFGPDEMLNLPGVSGALTARRIAAAINSGDETLARQIRAGVAAWRERTGESYADALLAAVERLSPAAVHPLRREPKGAIIVDASNVARQTPDPLALDKTGRVAYLTSMRDYLMSEGYFPVILLADANLGYQIDDPASYLSLVERNILIEVHSGGEADEALIREARQRNAPLITNDRLRDWKSVAADVRRIPFLILPGQILLEPSRRPADEKSAN